MSSGDTILNTGRRVMKCLPLALCLCLAACRTAGPGGDAAVLPEDAGAAYAWVRGNSLSPLLNDGDRVKIDHAYYKTHGVQKGDIVVCRFAFSRDPLIKLARAVPGDRFALKELPDGGALLLVNGAVLENSAGIPYKFSGRRKRMIALYEKDYKGIIPPGAYLLLGDSPEGSLDSGRFGLVGREAIIGKAAPVGGGE